MSPHVAGSGTANTLGVIENALRLLLPTPARVKPNCAGVQPSGASMDRVQAPLPLWLAVLLNVLPSAWLAEKFKLTWSVVAVLLPAH